MDRQTIIEASKKHDIVPGKYKYGTAGFRMAADLLEGVTFRVGLLSALRTRRFNGQAIGVMVTASHNPAQDNGVKIVDPMGDMLEQEWEVYATDLVNSTTHEILADTFFQLADQLKVNLKGPGKVIAGRDTRPSGITLVQALSDACAATNTAYEDFKILTTPQLHYLTRCINTEGLPTSYGEVSEAGYYNKLNDAFERALRGKKVTGSVTVDCANGVGAPKLHELLKIMNPSKTGLDCKVVNDDVLRPEVLNLDVSWVIPHNYTIPC
jgi:phosphoacetylglucosamine mutase